MLFFRRIILIGFIAILSSCEESEIIFPDGYTGDNGNGNQETEVYFTFKSYESTLFLENWIIIHTEDGALLDYRRYEKGEELIFEAEGSTVTDKIAITLYKYKSTSQGAGGNTNINFKTTLGVDKGSVWDNPPLEFQGSNPIGFFDLTLNNFPEIIGLFISNENHLVNFFANFTGTGTPGNMTYIPPSMELYEENEYCITFIEDSQDFKYHFIEDVQDGDNIFVNYDEFQFFDSYLSVDLPSDYFYDFSVKGLEEYQDIDGLGGYTLERARYRMDGYMSNFVDHNPLRIGYLDRYDKYKTSLDVSKENYIYEYRKSGDKPTEIIVVEEPNLSVNSAFVQNFEFNVDVNYTDYEVDWRSITGTFNVDYVSLNWKVEVPLDSDHIVGDIPEELLELYPYINTGFSGLGLNKVGLTISPEEKLRFYFGD